ncbi:MAG: Gmad2 immunoglobulin-like domain-containing protein [Chloroflexi bacterium]|nr:Gmad2 immunoglobulin-like domain-containing protein [Chloroflexota bacterium]MDA1002751.1 Gmad2 immunoglobulin-like domain-containing protein [Chloroflexota bacterium]
MLRPNPTLRLRTLAIACCVTAGLALSGGSTASAQQPGAAFSGVVHAGGISLLVTTQDSAVASLTAALAVAGCGVEGVNAIDTDTANGAAPAPPWSTYVEGAPAFVNADFPAVLQAATVFAVRCAPIVSPQLDLLAATVRIEGTDYTLSGGRAAVPAAPGSVTQIVSTLTNLRSYGDINGDGVADGAAVISHQPGGSGTFSYLAVFPTLSGTAAPMFLPAVLLGDRIEVQDLAIRNGGIEVTYLDRRASEPFSTAPTVSVARRYMLSGGALAAVAGACDDDLSDVGAFVFVTTPESGDEVVSGFGVEGCSRTFESNVKWVLYDRSGTQIASGFATGGGVDGPGAFAFTVSYTVSAAQLGRLEVYEEDASGGAGIAPIPNVIPVRLLP